MTDLLFLLLSLGMFLLFVAAIFAFEKV